MNDKPKCALCGEPMPAGEEMFKHHGYSGNCPKPPLPPKPQLLASTDAVGWLRANFCPTCKRPVKIVEPEPDPAPAVCVWTSRGRNEPGFYSTPHGIRYMSLRHDSCVSCGKPIAFTEANHG